MTDDLTVIYNDTCPICAREVAGYKRMTRDLGLDVRYVGLDADALQDYGLGKADAARRFHVLEGGRLYSGVEAFARLWQRLPRLRWLARLVRLPGIATLAALVYDRILAPALFALHRRRERRGQAYHRG